jgi:uncharacterized protein (UPF0335 family)
MRRDEVDTLKSVVRRVETLNDDIASLNSDKADVYAEADAIGLDVKTIKRLVKWRSDEVARKTEDELFEQYQHALGHIQDEAGTLDATRARTSLAKPESTTTIGEAVAGVVSGLAGKTARASVEPPDVPPAYRDTTRKPAGKALQS